MILGFTGSRYGAAGTAKQMLAVMAWLSQRSFDITEGHHGDCVGWDAEFHRLCLLQDIPVVIHPPVDEQFRAFCKGAKLVLPPKTHLARNRDIVLVCDHLIAAPVLNERGKSGGTWYTVNFAEKKKVPITIFWPDGRVEDVEVLQ